ncbi:MAG: glycosyltransferase family 2 protein [Candidatus Omnitrophica bacterium]|nr:glycosyltransferase family 2 protein [Candidatus Omnitrophota bacterium]
MEKTFCEISIVAPVFNEEGGITNFCDTVVAVMASANLDYEIVLVDDGSRDNSFVEMKLLRDKNARIRIVRLARNFGHQLAITAGMRQACGRCVVVMDCDLQDSPAVILQFLAKWREGFEIIHGVRKERKGETWFKKASAFAFYRVLAATTNISIQKDAGDFYLLDRKVIDVLNTMDERHRFMRGLLGWVGFKRTTVEYVREPRFTGVTKFSFWKMLKFSLDAATSFSFMPLRVISLIGLVISLIAFLGIGAILFVKLFTNYAVTGWSSLMVAVLFIGGIQLIAIGIIGEYLARIGDDVKGRPLYVITEVLE